MQMFTEFLDYLSESLEWTQREGLHWTQEETENHNSTATENVILLLTYSQEYWLYLQTEVYIYI